MKYIIYILVLSSLLLSCGGESGENKSSESNNKITYQSFSIYGEDIEKAVGFEIELISNAKDIKIEKQNILRNWEIKVRKDKDKIKILALNKKLKNIGKKEGILLNILSDSKYIKVSNYKVVDDFGNPLNSKLVLE